VSWRRYGAVAGAMALTVTGVLGGRALALVMSEKDAPGHAFTISGTAAGLAPGKRVPLRLTVSNPDAQPILVTSATATAQSASKSCPASLLSITAFSGNPQTVVAGRGKAVIELSITLSAQAPDSCRKVSFPLTFNGKAQQWH
jgi:hypothetical protein